VVSLVSLPRAPRALRRGFSDSSIRVQDAVRPVPGIRESIGPLRIGPGQSSNSQLNPESLPVAGWRLPGRLGCRSHAPMDNRCW
jgi:hypothetical protein